MMSVCVLRWFAELVLVLACTPESVVSVKFRAVWNLNK